MSVRAKGIFKKKVLETFLKMDIDEQMDTFKEIKEILNQKIQERVDTLVGFAEENKTKNKD